MEGKAFKEFLIDRGDSPWAGYTSSYDEERAGHSISAVAIGPGTEVPRLLTAYSTDGRPWLAIDRAARRVLVEATFFSDLLRPDATRVGGEAQAIGRVLDGRIAGDPARLFSFLLESQLIRTYWHVEARLSMSELLVEGKETLVRVSGEHVYFTNRRNADPLDFVIALEGPSGSLSIRRPR